MGHTSAASTTDPILNRVPLEIRNAYDAAWSLYASVCCSGGTPAERRAAYSRARKQEDRLQSAVRIAKAEHKRHLQRNAQHA